MKHKVQLLQDEWEDQETGYEERMPRLGSVHPVTTIHLLFKRLIRYMSIYYVIPFKV